MGRLIYNRLGNSIDVDDRTLAHLQIVIASKLRRRECFFFSWNSDASVGGGRNSIWVYPNAPLVFRFSSERPPRINPAWLARLNQIASSETGLRALPELESTGDVTASGPHALDQNPDPRAAPTHPQH